MGRSAINVRNENVMESRNTIRTWFPAGRMGLVNPPQVRVARVVRGAAPVPATDARETKRDDLGPIILRDVKRRIESAPVMSPESGDLRALLAHTLTRRCAGNEKYSLRAFARDLKIHHGTLSQILRNRRMLTPAMVKRLAPRLGLDATSTVRYALAAANAAFTEPAALRLARSITADAWAALSEWPHLAILELTRLPEFRADSRFIARVLGTSVDEVNLALQRLLRLGLLEMRDSASWRDLTLATSNDAFARETIRRLLDRLRTLADLTPALPDPPITTPPRKKKSRR